jgi:peroxiredoxin
MGILVAFLCLAQDASFKTQGGQDVKLSDYKKPVVVLFMRGFTGEFACYFCGIQTRDYKASFEKFKEAGAEILVVLPGAKDAPGYLKMVGESDEEHPDPKFSVPYSVVLDPDLAATKAFGIPCDGLKDGQPFPVSTPATIVIGKDGKALYKYQGKNPEDRPKAEQILEYLKTGKVPVMAGGEKPAADPVIAWMSYADGLKAAEEQKRPILIDFYADW